MALAVSNQELTAIMYQHLEERIDLGDWQIRVRSYFGYSLYVWICSHCSRLFLTPTWDRSSVLLIIHQLQPVAKKHVVVISLCLYPLLQVLPDGPMLPRWRLQTRQAARVHPGRKLDRTKTHTHRFTAVTAVCPKDSHTLPHVMSGELIKSAQRIE